MDPHACVDEDTLYALHQQHVPRTLLGIGNRRATEPPDYEPMKPLRHRRP